MMEKMMIEANTKYKKDENNVNQSINQSIKNLIFETGDFVEEYRQYVDRVGMKFSFVETKKSDQ